MSKRKGGARHERLASLLREEMTLWFRQNSFELSGLIVSSVQLTPDLRFARVFVRQGLDLNDSIKGDLEKQWMALLGRNVHALKSHLGKSLRLKYMPELRFEYDHTLAHAERIDELLKSTHSHEESSEDES